jgi:hypothetical protein
VLMRRHCVVQLGRRMELHHIGQSTRGLSRDSVLLQDLKSEVETVTRESDASQVVILGILI